MPGHEGVVEDIEEEVEEEEGERSDGEGIESGAGGGVVPGSALRGVGSRQQRQADGGYLTAAE